MGRFSSYWNQPSQTCCWAHWVLWGPNMYKEQGGWCHCFETHHHYHLLYFSIALPPQEYSQLWSHFILTTLWKRKEKMEERWELLWSAFYRCTKRIPGRSCFPKVTQWVGRWSWLLGHNPAPSTQNPHTRVTLNADNMQPHGISYNSYSGSSLSWESRSSISQVTQIHNHKMGYCFDRTLMRL